MQFSKAGIGPEWMDLANQFPEFILEVSPAVMEIFNESHQKGWEAMPDELENLCNLRYGFECDVGWKEIIREYFTKLKALIQKAKDNGDEIHYKTFIFKEKFGELRDQGDFYGPDKSKYWNEYIKLDRDIMQKSSKTCEVCGEPGTLMKKGKNWGWIKCVCDTHAQQGKYGTDLY